jgi:hypothetical protein
MIKPRRMRWAVHVGGMGEKWNVYRISMKNPAGRRTLGISILPDCTHLPSFPLLRLEDNIKTILRERELGGMDWIDLVQNWD